MAEDKTEAMVTDNGDDSGIGSNESSSRRESLASRISSAGFSNDSALGSDRRSSSSSNVSSMSGLSDHSLSYRASGQSSAGYVDSRRSSLSSVRSDGSTTTLRSDMTATSTKSERTSMTSTAYQQQGFGHVNQSTKGTNATSGYTRVGSPYSYGQSGQTRTTNTQPPSAIIQIQVVDYNGKTHVVKVRRTDKVMDLKVRVEEKLKIAPCQQRLQFQGKCLDDKSTCSLGSLGLQDLSTVYMQGRLAGGAPCK